MSEVRDVLLRIRGETRDAEQSLSKLEQSSSKLTDTIKTVGIASGVAFGAMAAAAAAVSKAANLADLGDQYLDLRNSFEAASVSAGKVSSVFLNELRTATDNAISDADLMKGTMRGLTLELEKSGVSIVDIAETVKDFADATGRDFPAAYDQFIGALATGRTMTLQTMGITIDAEKVIQDYAAANGKAVSELTNLEKQQAKQQAAVAELKRQTDNLTGGLEAMGLGSRNAGDAAQTLKAQMENARNEMLAGFAQSKSLAGAFDDVSKAMDGVDWETLGKGIGWLAGQFVTLLNQITNTGTALGNFTFDAVQTLKEFAGVNQGFHHQYGKLLDEINAKQREYDAGIGGPEKRKRMLAEIESLRGIKGAIEEVDKARVSLMNTTLAEYRSLTDMTGATVKQTKATDDNAGSIDKATGSTNKLGKELKETKLIAKDFFDVFDQAGSIQEMFFGKADTRDLSVQVQDLFREITKASEDAARASEQAQKEAYRASVDFYEDILTGLYDGNISNVLENMLTRAAVKFGAEMLAQITGAFSAQQLFGGASGGFDLGSLFSLGSSFFGGGTSGGSIDAYLGAYNSVAGGFGGSAVSAGGGGGMSTLASLFGFGGSAAGGAGASGGAAGALGGISTGAALSGAAAAAYYGWQGYEAYGKLTSGDTKTESEGALQSALLSGMVTAWLAPFAGEIQSLTGWGSGKGGDQQYREAVVGNLYDAGLVDKNYNFSMFGGGKYDLGDNTRPDGTNISDFSGSSDYQALGSIIGALGGGDGSSGSTDMFANMLASADDLNVAILTVVGSLEQVGMSTEQFGDAITQAMLNGEISIESYNEQMEGLLMLNLDSLESLEDGWNLLAATIGGKPRDSIKAFELLYQEMAESGINDTEAMVSYIRDKLGDEAAMLFQQLAENGIDQFTDFSQLSQGQIQLLVNSFNLLIPAIEELGGATSGVASNMEQDTERMAKSLRKVGDEAKSTSEKLKAIRIEA